MLPLIPSSMRGTNWFQPSSLIATSQEGQSTKPLDMGPSPGVARTYSTAAMFPPSSPCMTGPESCNKSSKRKYPTLVFISIISGSSLSEGWVLKKAYMTGKHLIQQLSSSLAYLGDSIWDQNCQEPCGAPSKVHEVPELEEKHVTKEVKDEASHHLFSWGKISQWITSSLWWIGLHSIQTLQRSTCISNTMMSILHG